jgi:hypothetical protein
MSDMLCCVGISTHITVTMTFIVASLSLRWVSSLNYLDYVSKELLSTSTSMLCCASITTGITVIMTFIVASLSLRWVSSFNYLNYVFLKNCYQLGEIQRSPTSQLSSFVYDCNSRLSGHEDQRTDRQTRGIIDFGRFILLMATCTYIEHRTTHRT